MKLRELINQMVENKVNLDAEIVFVKSDSHSEKFKIGIIDVSDNLIRFG